MPSSVIDISTMNPKQARFFKSDKRFIGYGGARGGGKSWAIDRKAPLLHARGGVFFFGRLRAEKESFCFEA